MADKKLTIDNLGVAASKQYAASQKIIQDSLHLTQDTRSIGQSVETLVTTPNTALSEFDQKYSLKGSSGSWALFSPPKGYEANTLFSHSLIPSLGEYEKIEANEEKLKAMHGTPHEEPILNLLKCTGDLDKILKAINARRMQYQRG